MEKSSKRGKIPQQDWPSIIERYEAGETLASIARTYDCSPPAISYIVSRTRARGATADATGNAAPSTAPAVTEPQLLKGPTAETLGDNGAAEGIVHTSAEDRVGSLAVTAAEPKTVEQPTSAAQPDTGPPQPDPGAQNNQRGLFPEYPPPDLRMNDHPQGRDGLGPRHGDLLFGGQRPAANGSASRPSDSAAAPPQNSDSRRTLHLSLPHGNGNGPHVSDPVPQNTPNFPGAGAGDRFPPRPASGQAPIGQPPRQGQSGQYPPPGASPAAAAGNAMAHRAPGDGQRMKDGGAFIDRTLRERVDADIAAFLAAFDAALDHDTSESRIELREATDRLLRAGARTRIELERLEARAPLPARDRVGPTAPLFRHR